jgi:hypothetical protein
MGAAISLSGRAVVCFTTQDLTYLATVPTADVVPAPSVARAAESDLRDETLVAFDTSTNRGGMALEAEVPCATTGIFSCGSELFLDNNVSTARCHVGIFCGATLAFRVCLWGGVISAVFVCLSVCVPVTLGCWQPSDPSLCRWTADNELVVRFNSGRMLSGDTLRLRGGSIRVSGFPTLPALFASGPFTVARRYPTPQLVSLVYSDTGSEIVATFSDSTAQVCVAPGPCLKSHILFCTALPLTPPTSDTTPPPSFSSPISLSLSAGGGPRLAVPVWSVHFPVHRPGPPGCGRHVHVAVPHCTHDTPGRGGVGATDRCACPGQPPAGVPSRHLSAPLRASAGSRIRAQCARELVVSAGGVHDSQPPVPAAQGGRCHRGPCPNWCGVLACIRLWGRPPLRAVFLAVGLRHVTCRTPF